MAVITNTLAQELEEQGIIGSYIWKPNRFYARSGDNYISADVVTDGTAAEITDAVRTAGQTQIATINQLGTSQLNELHALEGDYANVKTNLIQTYTRMYNYFVRQGMVALATIMATAIVNLNNL